MQSLGRATIWPEILILLVLGIWPAAPGADPKPRTGDFKDELKDPGSGTPVMRYRMRVPDRLPATKTLGLIVAFHGLRGNENDLTGFAIDAARRVGIADEYVIMGGKSKGEGWEAKDDKDVLAWIAWARDTYPIDARRVHLVGMSNGGGMVKRFGWANQDLFASVSSYCGVTAEFSGAVKGSRAPPARGPGSPAETRTEWYLVHGDADTTVPADASRLAFKQLTAKGYRCIYREIDGGDHGSILGCAEVVDDNFRLLHALRHKEIPPGKEERAALASMASKLKGEKAETALPLVAEAARVGGAAGAGAIKAALGNGDVAVKLAAMRATETVAFGREIALELIKLTRDKSAEVKAAAFQSLGSLARWRYPEAQEFLFQTARKGSLAVDDRVAAIQALGKPLKLLAFGWYEDGDVPWSLVLLLEDKEVKVREAAFASLKAGLKDTCGYAPDLAVAERKAAAARLRAWCEKQVGPFKGPGAQR